MSWYTILTTNITFSHKTYDKRYEVESDLEETNKIIKMYEDELLSLIMTTEPKKMMSRDEIDSFSPIDWLKDKYNTIKEQLEEYYIERYRLNLLLDDWDKCHDEKGLAIPLTKLIDEKDEYGYKKSISAVTEKDIMNLNDGHIAFLDGDFIKTIYNKDDE